MNIIFLLKIKGKNLSINLRQILHFCNFNFSFNALIFEAKALSLPKFFSSKNSSDVALIISIFN